jgi:hypothetical protein
MEALAEYNRHINRMMKMLRDGKTKDFAAMAESGDFIWEQITIRVRHLRNDPS